jgi:hypothetical protein
VKQLAFVAIFLAACGDKPAGPTVTTTTSSAPASVATSAPISAPQTKPQARLKISGVEGKPAVGCKGDLCDGKFSAAGTTMTVKLKGDPALKVEIQGKQFAVSEAGSDAQIDLLLAALGVPAKSLESSPTGVDIEVRIIAPDKTVSKETVRFDVEEVLLAFVRSVEQHALVFPVEGAAKFKKDSMIVFRDASVWAKGDENARLWDVDLVAFEKETEVDGSPCRFYDEKGNVVDKLRSGVSLDLTVYDRRSGKKVVTKKYPVRIGACPKEMKASEFLDYGYDGEAHEKLMTSLVQEHPAGEEEIPLPVATIAVPASAVVGPPLPPLEKMKERFWKLGYQRLGEEDNDFKDFNGTDSFHLLGTKTGSKAGWALRVVSLANAAKYDSKPYFVLGPRSMLVVTTIGGDLQSAKDIFELINGKTAKEMLAYFRADGWKDVQEDPTDWGDGLNELNFRAEKGDLIANISFHEWSGIIDGKADYEAIHVAKDGYAFASGDSKEAARATLDAVLK